MGREQGDEMGDEVFYLHPDNPEWGPRPAASPADHVNLQARGWVRRDRQSKTANRPATAQSRADAGGAESNAESGRA